MTGYKWKRTIYVFFAMLIFLSGIPANTPETSAEEVSLSLGEIIDEWTSPVAPGVLQSTLELESEAGKQHLHVLDIEGGKEHLSFETGLSNGKVLGMQKTTEQAQSVSRDGHRVIGAVNGDFYNTSNGLPIHLMIHKGEIYTSPVNRTALGFKENGEAVIGVPQLAMSIKINGEYEDVPGQFTLNKGRGANDLVLYSETFSDSTKTSDEGTEVIVRIDEGEVRSGNKISGTVVSVEENTGNSALEEGYFVLSARGNSEALLTSLSDNDQLEISFTLSDEWGDVQEAVGGNHLLVDQGEVTSEAAGAGNAVAPRTAAGIREDGSVFFAVVDGRNPGYSEGVTIKETAQLMKEYGAEKAVNLDGGGSSTMLARQPGETEADIVNVPSDGVEREVANSLLLVSNAKEGPLSQLAVLPQQLRILSGSSYSFAVKGMDEFHNPAEIEGEPEWSVANLSGSITDDGIFTAGSEAGRGTIHASAGEASGISAIEVVNELTDLAFPQSEITVDPADTIVLEVSAYNDRQKVYADNEQFTWNVEGDIGTIDNEGVFTAADRTGSGTITVSYGSVEATVKVEVGKEPVILEDFENGIDHWYVHGARYTSIDMSLATAPADPVRFGNHAMRLDYDFTGQQGTSGVYASPYERIEVEGYPERIGMWVYGDGNNQWLRAQMRDGDNNWFPVNFTENHPDGLTWEGWKYVEADVPKGRPAPLEMEIPVRYMATYDDNKTAGTLYIDQIRAVYGETNEDLINPSLTDMKPEDGSIVNTNTPEISIVASDDEGGSGIDPESVELLINGETVNAEFDESTGEISYTPEEAMADGYNVVYAAVKDLSGNPAFAEWSFHVESGGPQYRFSGPEEIYAGLEFTVELTIDEPSQLQGMNTELTFDPDIVQVVDGDPDREGVQVHIGEKFGDEQIITNEADNENGRIFLAFDNLLELGNLDTQETAAEITFSVNREAAGNFALNFVYGEIAYSDGRSMTTRLLPHTATVGQPLSLSVKGVSYGSTSEIQVINQQTDEPVEGAEVHIIDPELGLLTIDEDTPVYSAIGGTVTGEALADDRYLFSETRQNYYRIYLPDGSRGWVSSSAASTEDWGTPLGITDNNGVFITDTLALSVLTYRIQAVKDELVSQIAEISIVPQLGGKTPENLVLTWQQSPKTTQSFTWRTAPPVEGSVAEFVPESDFTDFSADNVQRAEGTSFLFTDNLGEMRIHEAEATGLEPGTTYIYRTGNGEPDGWSEPYSFTTEPAGDEAYTFLFTADSQAVTREQFSIWTELFNNALVKHPDARFMLHGGDIVENGNLLQEWEYFFEASEGLISRIPFMAVLGNHDVYGDGEETFRSVFQYPQNGPEGQEEFVYSFEYGEANFLMLNSESTREEMEQQAEWLKEEVNNSGKTWQIAMFHRPPYLSNPLRGDDLTKEILAPALEESGVDLVLVGHDHAYSRTYPMFDGATAEEGTVYITGGSAGPKFYPGEEYDYIEKLFDEDIQIFSALTVDSNEISLEVTTIDGHVVDAVSFEKDTEEPVNNPPSVNKPVENQVSNINQQLVIDISETFTDEDGDTLVYSVSSSREDIATAVVENEELIIDPVSKGRTEITLTADDGRGGTAEDSFNAVFVPEQARPGRNNN